MVECYCQEELVGLIISYDNDVDSCRGYTTFCAVKGGYRGNNIAGKLLERACTHAKRKVCVLWACIHIMKLQRGVI